MIFLRYINECGNFEFPVKLIKKVLGVEFDILNMNRMHTCHTSNLINKTYIIYSSIYIIAYVDIVYIYNRNSISSC